MHLLGLDIGTTGCKAVVYDLLGREKGYSILEYGILCEQSNWAEQEPEVIWESVKEVIANCVAQARSNNGVNVKDIAALCISVQGEAIIPVDRQYRPLYRTILGMDYRAIEEVAECSKQLAEKEWFQRTGLRPHPMSSITKMMWLKKHRPEIYGQAYKIMTYSDFIFSRMGAECIIDYSQASRTMAFNISQKSWDTEILKKIEIDQEKLSNVVPSGKIVGKMKSSLAEELGLHKHLYLVTGGHDQTCAGIGAGAIRENIAVNATGTAEVLGVAFSRKVLNDIMFDGYYPCYCHAKSDMYYTLSVNQVGGLLFRWFRDQFAGTEMQEAEENGRNAYEILSEKAPKEPSNVLVLPHLIGSGTPWCDFTSKGALVGITMNTTRHDITKAIFDSLTYELRINVERLRDAGVAIGEFCAIGGAAQSPLWMQVKADVMNCSVSTMAAREAGCLGTAILAGVAVGAFKDIQEAVSSAVKVKRVYEPDPKMVGRYEEKFEKYKALYPALKDLHRQL